MVRVRVRSHGRRERPAKRPVRWLWGERLEDRRLLATASLLHVFRDDDFSLSGTFRFDLQLSDYRDSITNGQFSGTGHIFWESPSLGQATFDGTATGSGGDQVFFGGSWRNCSNHTIRDEGALELSLDAAQKKITVTSANSSSTVYTQYTDLTGGFCPAENPFPVYFGGLRSKYSGTFDATAFTAAINYADASSGVTRTSPAASVTWANSAPTDFVLTLAARNGAPPLPADWVEVTQPASSPAFDVLDAQHGQVEISIEVLGKAPPAPAAGPTTPVGNLQLSWASDATAGATLEAIPVSTTSGPWGVYWNNSLAQAVVGELPPAPAWARYVKASITAAGFTESNTGNNSAFLPIRSFAAQAASTANHPVDQVLDLASGSLLGAADAARYPQVTVYAYAPQSRLGADVVVTNARGAFLYDPTGVTAFQSLAQGETLDDFIDFMAIENGTFADDTTHRVTLVGVNDLPVAIDDAAATREDTRLKLVPAALLANDRDPDHGDRLVLAELNASSVYGATVFVGDDGLIVYDPSSSASLRALSAGDTIEDWIDYRIVDRAGAEAWGGVRVTVSGVNDPPEVLSADPAVMLLGETSASTNLTVRDWDTDPGLLALAVLPAASPLLDSQGIQIADLGGWNYGVTLTPAASQTGRVRLTARVTSPAPEAGAGTRDFFLVVGTADDVDLDGVPNAVEDAGPFGGDADGDGHLDSTQPHRSSFRSASDNQWLALSSSTTAALDNVRAVAVPAASGVAAGTVFPWDGASYQMVVAPGASATLRWSAESTPGLNAFFGWTPVPGGTPGQVHWDWLMWNGQHGAQVFADHVDLVVQDGGRGDADGVANGVIIGQGAPGKTTFPWHNPAWREDVNHDGRVVPLDGLNIVNYLNSAAPRSLPQAVLAGEPFPLYLDVVPDNLVAPIDALYVINFLNGVGEAGEGGGVGEGEAAEVTNPAEVTSPAAGAASELGPLIPAVADWSPGGRPGGAGDAVLWDESLRAARTPWQEPAELGDDVRPIAWLSGVRRSERYDRGESVRRDAASSGIDDGEPLSAGRHSTAAWDAVWADWGDASDAS